MNQHLDTAQARALKKIIEEYQRIGSYFIIKVAKLQSHFARLKMLHAHAHRKFHQNGFRTHITTCRGAATARNSITLCNLWAIGYIWPALLLVYPWIRILDCFFLILKKIWCCKLWAPSFIHFFLFYATYEAERFFSLVVTQAFLLLSNSPGIRF